MSRRAMICRSAVSSMICWSRMLRTVARLRVSSARRSLRYCSSNCRSSSACSASSSPSLTLARTSCRCLVYSRRRYLPTPGQGHRPAASPLSRPEARCGVAVFEDPAASSRVLSLRREGFTALLNAAAVGDTIRIADAARLFRSVADILALRPVLIRRGLHRSGA